MRVAAATSNFMIGVTALSSFVVYWARGYVEPGLCAPLVVGVATGSVVSIGGAGTFDGVFITGIVAVLLAGITSRGSGQQAPERQTPPEPR